MIPTGQLLADIARSLGYEVVGIDLFRTRLATASKEQLREEVVVLRWTGTAQVATQAVDFDDGRPELHLIRPARLSYQAESISNARRAVVSSGAL